MIQTTALGEVLGVVAAALALAALVIAIDPRIRARRARNRLARIRRHAAAGCDVCTRDLERRLVEAQRAELVTLDALLEAGAR